jgi:hypothetical protein
MWSKRPRVGLRLLLSEQLEPEDTPLASPLPIALAPRPPAGNDSIGAAR